jgi:thiosulfate dehydrogenase [quinone] large subunit
MEHTHSRYTSAQAGLLGALRILIGWHLLYEGVVKLWNPGWSAGGYLMDSQGAFAELFYALAANPQVLAVIDFLNVWGLILVGLGLIAGLFTRLALIGGIVLLSLYYLSHPPLIGVKYALPSEGSYLFVNKNLIEIVAMAVLLVFPTGRMRGLDGLLQRWRQRNRTEPTRTVTAETPEPVIH